MQNETKTANDPEVIDVDPEPVEIEVVTGETPEVADARDIDQRKPAAEVTQRLYLLYIILPVIFLTVALLGGLRLSGEDASFVFLRPALVCLVFAALMIILFFRAGLIRMEGWFSEGFSTLKNLANAAVLATLFAASTQMFNSLIPESGLPFWIVAFCFFWTLWNNLFADFDTKKLLRSLGGLFGLAFVVKYLLLSNLTAPASDNWLRAIIENPAQEAFTWLLDLPRFSPGTGYIQFFTVVLYLLGLYLLPSGSENRRAAAFRPD